MSDVKVEVESISDFTHIPAEIPVARMESDSQPEDGDVQSEPVPSMLYLDVDARENADLAPTTMVSQATGVVTIGNAVDLTDDDHDADEVVHKVEDVPDDEDDDDNTPHENDYHQAEEPVVDKEYGCGIRIRKQ